MQVQDLTPGVAASGLRVDGARLWDSLMRLARIGATDKGGVCRLALTELDRDARDRAGGGQVQRGLQAGQAVHNDQRTHQHVPEHAIA